MESCHETSVQAAYSNTSIHQQLRKVVDNVHWCGGEQAEVVVVENYIDQVLNFLLFDKQEYLHTEFSSL